jgi:hypothetical protein
MSASVLVLLDAVLAANQLIGAGMKTIGEINALRATMAADGRSEPTDEEMAALDLKLDAEIARFRDG